MSDVKEEDIHEYMKALPQMIREYAREQADMWRQIPHLALQADGRTGHNERYARAYQRGVWDISPDMGDLYRVAEVDCETGEILRPRTQGMEPVPTDAYEAAAIQRIVEAGDVYEDNLRKDMYAAYGKQGEETVKDLQDRGAIHVDANWNYRITRSNPDRSSDQMLLQIAPHLEELDADSIVEQLRERASQPHGSYYDEEEKKEWRKKQKEWFDVTPTYERRSIGDVLEDWSLPEPRT